jgi:hypothetical protein
MIDKKPQPDIPKIISIVGSLLLCAGIISQTIYYFFFNIPITEFLSISEILLLFTQDVIRYIIIFILLFFIGLLTNYRRPAFRNKRLFINYTSTKSFWLRFRQYAEYRFNSLIYYFFGAVTLVALLYEKAKIAYLFALYFSIELIYYIIRFLLLENRRLLRLKGALKKEDSNLNLSFSLGLHFIFFILCWTLIDVQRVKYEQRYINVSFRLSTDTLIKSDSTRYYIGQTDKYLFYYDSKVNVTTVYKKDDVKQLYFGKINYFKISTEKK